MTSSAPRPEAVRVAVFAKAPVPGEVKTRLAAILGADGAAALHSGLVRHALATAVESRLGEVELCCTPDTSHPFFARCAAEFGVRLAPQRGADLGGRMREAIDRCLAAGAAAIVIGADCAVLRAGHLRSAAEALARHDAVIIPADDGGYVLLGLAAPVPAIFEGIDWGTPAVLRQTRERFGACGMTCVELPALWDVDRPEDYARLQSEGLLAEVLS
jgi:hypothetical protein